MTQYPLQMEWTDRQGRWMELPAGAHARVLNFSRRAMGGSYRALIGAQSADPRALSPLLGWLRCGLRISDGHARPLWGGYVNAVSLQMGAITQRVSLQGMSNRVAVAYTSAASPTQRALKRFTTPWAEDAGSIAEYGVKEWLAPLPQADAPNALRARDTFLQERALPFVSLSRDAQSQTNAAVGATPLATVRLECCGWYSALAWQYAGTLQTPAPDTLALAMQVALERGAFFTGWVGLRESGQITAEAWGGETRALDVFEGLLACSCADGRPLYAETLPDRRLYVYTPDERDLYQVCADGSLRDPFGQPVEGANFPAGVFASVQNLHSGNIQGSLRAQDRFFVNECRYNALTGKVQLVNG